LAACLAYVDLNPIRARIAETPEASQFTSVYERIQALGLNAVGAVTESTPGSPDGGTIVHSSDPSFDAPPVTTNESRADWLSPFELSEAQEREPAPKDRASNKGCLPMRFAEYLKLLDWTGRQLRADKRGAIPPDLAPILERLHIGDEGWMQLMARFSRLFRRAAGRPHSMQKEQEQHGCRVMQGIRHSRQIFV
jgi:hypothetical protein